MDITAQYKEKVVTTNPQDSENYAHVTFTTTKGTIDGTKEYWVLKNEEVTVKAPTVNMGEITDYTFKAWDPEVKTIYTADEEHKATFNKTSLDPSTPIEDFEQTPTTDDGKPTVEVTIPEGVKPGTVIEVKKGDDVVGTTTIPKDKKPGDKVTITLDKEKVEDGDQVTVVTDEEGKTPTESTTKVTLDLQAPDFTTDASIKDSTNRLFLDFEGTVNEDLGADTGITVIFEGKDYPAEYDPATKKVTVKNLIPRPENTDTESPVFKVTLVDGLNNKQTVEVNSYQTKVYASKFDIVSPFLYDDYLEILGSDKATFKVEIIRDGHTVFSKENIKTSGGSVIVELGDEYFDSGDILIVTNAETGKIDNVLRTIID